MQVVKFLAQDIWIPAVQFRSDCDWMMKDDMLSSMYDAHRALIYVPPSATYDVELCSLYMGEFLMSNMTSGGIRWEGYVVMYVR